MLFIFVGSALKSQLQEVRKSCFLGASASLRPGVDTGAQACRSGFSSASLCPGLGGCAQAWRVQHHADFVKNLFRRISDLDSFLFYTIDLFLIFRHIFFYK
jgi:hypothetical protein